MTSNQPPFNSPSSPTDTAESQVIAFDGHVLRDEPRTIAVEAPVQIAFSDVPFAVMMLTPADLVDFAYGFSLTEGLIERAEDIRDVALFPQEGGFRLAISLPGPLLHRHLARQRAMTGRTGCGICGIDDIEALRRARGACGEAMPVAVTAIAKALVALDDRQNLYTATRAVHGAAFADLTGEIVAVREDVGRHNALDKLIGSLLRAGRDPRDGFVIITSRCSFEMVEKAATFGARTIVAISAPTSLAVERAQALDLTLVAIARRDTVTAFTHKDRLLVERK